MKPITLTTLLGLLWVGAGGCQQDPYAIIALGDGAVLDLGESDYTTECVPTNDGVEICDYLDNDCNGKIDDGFNLLTNPKHCGECNHSCLMPGAMTVCELGKCKYLGCAPGFIDLNADETDGCEYECTFTGEEICDGIDNDCNGKIDEVFDLTNDVKNCGKCGTQCLLANAVAKCEDSTCRIYQCKPGFIDQDGKDDNGCEVPCVKSNDGLEICDGIDNDCNGVIDDPNGIPIDFSSDPLNCGGCNIVCVLSNATSECQQGECIITSCLGDFLDADQDPINGCECTVQGEEICDNIDNDCNGAIDDNLPSIGPCGTDVGECSPGQLMCIKGLVTCVNKVGPQPELCDNLDNDCNGIIDDNVPSLGICGSDVGECRPGTLLCENGVGTCTGQVGPQPEFCDGKDNDCDGVIDNDIPPLGPCGSDVGECVPGQYMCVNGYAACTGKIGPQPESCDGLDNDCNGVPDDNLLSLGLCGTETGECQLGVLTCLQGQPVCTGGVGPTTEICDGKDNDCNGVADDNVSGFGGPCGSSDGECTPGTLLCQAGTILCVGGNAPGPEYCDGLDTDCDTVLDHPACIFPATGREQRLDQIGSPAGTSNSGQLHVAGSGSRVLALWLDRRSGHADIYANLSTDGGQSWGGSDFVIAGEGSHSKVEPRAAFGGPTASSIRAYVVYEHFDGDGVDGQRDIYLRRSTQGGASGSWSAPVLVERANPATGDALFVKLAVSPGATSGDADTVAVCWERIQTSGPIDPNVRCNISLDSGQTFPENDVQVNSVDNSVNDGALVPDIAIDGDYLYVTWQQFDYTNPSLQDQIRVARSALTAPLSFGNETLLSPQIGRNPRIATDGTGTVIVVWEDIRSALTAIRANRSTDQGGGWLTDGALVSNDVVNGFSTAPWIAMRPGGRAFVTWADTNRGKADIYVNSSDDGGLSWPGIQRLVSVEADGPGASTSRRPHIALSPDNDNVYIAWEDYRNGPDRDIYFSLSTDNGLVWNIPDYRINESIPTGNADAHSPFVWASPGRAAVIWMDNRLLSAGNHITGQNTDIYSSYLE